jgi:hypothetical protein
MVGCIFAEQTLTACFVELDEARDHFAHRQGLRPYHRLLLDSAVCSGLKGKVRQPELFEAMLINAEIDAFCPGQVRDQTPDEKSSSAVRVCSRVVR